MNKTETPSLTVQDGIVVTLEYTLRIDGEIIEQTGAEDGVQFIQGAGEIVPGLERGLYGMRLGESKTITVPPNEGYGEYDDGAVGTVPKKEFPDEIPLEIGVRLQLKDKDGDVLDAVVEGFDGENVVLNFNHPLAGKQLDYSVRVISLRLADPDELEHGHVHV